ncbi:hypothetical protein BDV18DRAFT_11436 [Aspergillus unguis]
MLEFAPYPPRSITKRSRRSIVGLTMKVGPTTRMASVSSQCRRIRPESDNNLSGMRAGFPINSRKRFVPGLRGIEEG